MSEFSKSLKILEIYNTKKEALKKINGPNNYENIFILEIDKFYLMELNKSHKLFYEKLMNQSP